MPISPLNPERDSDLMRFYVAPVIRKIPRGTAEETTEIKSYNELFFPQKPLHTIYLHGEAGIGKSTFATKVVMDWCESSRNETPNKSSKTDYFQDKEHLSCFEYLFFLPLKEANAKFFKVEELVHELIFKELYPNRKKDILRYIHRLLSEKKCLVILDGLDEWSFKGRKEVNVPMCPSRSCSTFLFTTRPWKMNQISVKDSEENIIQITLEGLTCVKELVHKVFEIKNERERSDKQADTFLDEIKKASLNHMLKIPILAMQLICLYFDDCHPTGSVTQLYSNMVEMLLKRLHGQYKGLDKTDA